MKVFFRALHLYLGLAAGLIIMIACITGAILVFEKELQEVFNHERYYVKPEGARMSLSEITASVKKQYQEAKIAGIKVYSDNKRSIEVSLILPEKETQNGKIAEVEGKKPDKNELRGRSKEC